MTWWQLLPWPGDYIFTSSHDGMRSHSNPSRDVSIACNVWPLLSFLMLKTSWHKRPPASAWWFAPLYIAPHPSLFSIYLIKLRHVSFNHSASSFTPPVLPLSISILWSGGRMKVRRTPATVKVLSLSLLNSSVHFSSRSGRCLLG